MNDSTKSEKDSEYEQVTKMAAICLLVRSFLPRKVPKIVQESCIFSKVFKSLENVKLTKLITVDSVSNSSLPRAASGRLLTFIVCIE